jgi:hypothetical protein
MAPTNVYPPPGTYVITLKFEPSDDVEITCVVCGAPGCDLAATVYDSQRRRITMGKHTRCTWVMVDEALGKAR